MRRLARAVVPLVVLFMVVFTVGCGAEPPNKEMNQAHGAIDAARAAGADRVAAAEFAAAVDALKKSEDAVAAGDYRLALNHALDSREQAQNASKLAVEGRANSRGEAERAIAEAATLLARAETQLKDSDLAKVPAARLKSARATVERSRQSLQEARSALAGADYVRVKTALGAISSELQAALNQIDAAASPATPRRQR